LASSLSTNVRRDLFELAGRALLLHLDGFHRDLVLEEPGRIFPSPQNELGICLLSLNDSLLDLVVDRRLHGTHEASAHVDALGSQA